MRPNDLHHRGNFLAGKAKAGQERRCLIHRVRHTIPGSQACGVFRAVAHEHSEVMQPRGGVQDIVIVRPALR